MTLPCSEQKTLDVLGFGIAAVDDLLLLPSHPQPGEKLAILSTERVPGGQTVNALVAAARLGAATAYASPMGSDDHSEFIRQSLRAAGVRVTQLRPSSHKRPYHSVILVDANSAERTILFNPSQVEGADPEDIDDGLIRCTRVLLADQLNPRGTLHAIEVAREADVDVVGDFERIDSPEIDRAVALTNHLIMPLALARNLTGMTTPEDVIRSLAGSVQRDCTGVTAGAEGCWFSTDQGTCIRHQPAFEVVPIDTTGCGDVFHGAYAAALAKGCIIAECIEIASATAALKTRQRGGQAGLPTPEELSLFLKRPMFESNQRND